MTNRFVLVAGVAVCAAGVAACSSGSANSPQPPGSLPTTTAQVTVNGKSAGTTHQLQCAQDGWTHTIKTGDQTSGVTLVVEAGDKVTAKSVVITNVSGFSGSVWESKIGNAQAQVIGTTFRVQGTAQGANTDEPNHPTTATFDIKANC